MSSKETRRAAARTPIVNVRRIRVVGAATLMLGILSTQTLAADAETRVINFSIASQPMSQALTELGAQSGLTIIVETRLSKGMTAGALSGSYTPEQALRKLLDPAGLKAEYLDSKTVAVRSASETTSQAVTAGRPLRLADNTRRGSRDAVGSGAEEDPDSSASSAQDAPVVLDEVIVTGTHISQPGFVAPTPTIVLTADEMQAYSRTDLGTVLADLPVSRNTISDITNASRAVAGGRSSSPNLRALGSGRTLTLIDGQRPVPINGNGGINVNAIPMGLVERVEIVTGGASAAYGSDAVAGVVNIIMADRRDGLRASAQYRGTTEDAADEYAYNFDASYGFSFADDRAHVILGGNYSDQSTIGPQALNPILTWGVIPNPAAATDPSAPQSLLAPDIRLANVSLGGLIVGCSTGGAGGPGGPGGGPVGPGGPGGPGGSADPTCGGLKGLTFEADGTTRPFVFGNYANQTTMSGGSDPQSTSEAYYASIRAPVTTGNAFGRFSFDLTDDLRFTTDVRYSNTSSDSPSTPVQPMGTIAIRRDNAFLPDNIRAAMPTNVQSLLIGRIAPDWGIQRVISSNNTLQGAVGLDGKFGDSWSWDVFYSYGKSRASNRIANQVIGSKFAAAVDAVNIGGQIQCRDLAANPGCVPLNVFGAGNASQAALDYVLGTRELFLDVTQREASAVLRGNPFSIWAGPVSIAAGAEWRRLRSSESNNNALFGPAPPETPSEDEVKEGFFETAIPLIKDLPLTQALTLNGAVRRSRYQLARGDDVTTWKIGVTDDINDELRLRYTRSRDIRAPNLTELNPFVTEVPGSVLVDPRTNTQVGNITVFRNGAVTSLEPEAALTTTYGVVYRPAWVRGLELSLDFYEINIDDYIAGLSPQEILNRCVAGNAALCALINGGSFNPASDPVTQVAGGLVNVSQLVAKGADFEAAYSTSLPRGRLTSRLILTYADELTLSDGVTVTNGAGVNGSTGDMTMTTPRLRATLSERYQVGSLSFDARARYVGGGVRRRDLTLDNNHIGSITYVDLGARYQTSLLGKLSIELNVTNAFDRDPPATPSPVFDLIGRIVSLGVRADF